ncbi:hypothetical protein BJ508DRAFT_311335 [Ascobolus immersus RN42]|uniref:Uncharacterized protein n=1 Tax=Ascobolus immersus RN42 TaxID=1160509 RepID=A0A3N4HUD7_ASCIM|nr:hypothetical protein BJ508DRAFT_311335 [Ascobolus immersus RN42]
MGTGSLAGWVVQKHDRRDPSHWHLQTGITWDLHVHCRKEWSDLDTSTAYQKQFLIAATSYERPIILPISITFEYRVGIATADLAQLIILRPNGTVAPSSTGTTIRILSNRRLRCCQRPFKRLHLLRCWVKKREWNGRWQGRRNSKLSVMKKEDDGNRLSISPESTARKTHGISRTSGFFDVTSEILTSQQALQAE